MKAPKAKYPVIYCLWIDPHSIDAWIELESEKIEVIKCESIGYLVKETSEYIALSPVVQSNHSDIACTMVIPKECIRYRKTLWKMGQALS